MNPVLAEYLGTTALLASTVFLGSPLAVAGTLFVVLLLIGKVSGGHVNPAKTLLAFVTGTISQSKAVSFVLAQIAAVVTVYLLKTRM
jgi:glycerol uptake facilitator-like aquaporin